MRKRVLAILLTLCLLLAVAPVGAWAADGGTTAARSGALSDEERAAALDVSDGTSKSLLLATESGKLGTGYIQFTPKTSGFHVISCTSESLALTWNELGYGFYEIDGLAEASGVLCLAGPGTGEMTQYKLLLFAELQADQTYWFSVLNAADTVTVAVEDLPEWSAAMAPGISIRVDDVVYPQISLTVDDHIYSLTELPQGIASVKYTVSNGAEKVRLEETVAEDTASGPYKLTGLLGGTATLEAEVTFCGMKKTASTNVTIKDYSEFYENLTWKVEDRVLTIGGTGAIPGWQEENGMPAVDVSPWRRYAQEIDKIVIQEGITKIGEDAFVSYSEASVELPDSLTEIGSRAFRYSINLTQVKLPSKLTALPEGVFTSCRSLKQIELPKSLKTIGTTAFGWCNTMESITLPDGVAVGQEAFISCSNLKDIYCEGTATFAPFDMEAGCALSTGAALTVHYPAGNADAAAYIKEATEQHKSCGRCSITWEQESAEPEDPCANGHSFTEHKVLKASTDKVYGSMQYTCTVCKKTVTEELPLNTYADIKLTKDTEWYYAPALWAIENNITDGMNPADKEFVPEGLCTRAQVVTFLWRAAGKPEPKSMKNPFVDVKDTTYTNWYYKAVLWAVEEGITTGTDATHFDPDKVCNRAMVATFIWRANGKPGHKITTSPFSDVKNSKEYYYDAVLWATETGVINGMGDGTYAPMTDCQRAHVVAMLYRDAMR